MTERIEKALFDLKALQQAGEHMPCPRCGRDTMKPVLHTNALSRHTDGIYVCDDCGTAEAMLDFMNNPLPLGNWAIFQDAPAGSDFKDFSGEDAERIIRAEHVPRLIRIFKQWNAGGLAYTDLRRKAMQECPGLTQLWERPFQAQYCVSDGEILVRFREKSDNVEVAVAFLQK